DRDESDRDEQTVDEVVAREAEERLVGEIPGGGGDEARGDDRHGVRQVEALGQRVRRVGADHHELAQREVHDARDAERQRDAERDDPVHGADDGAIQDLPEDELRHPGYFGLIVVTSMAPPFFRRTTSKLKMASPFSSKRKRHMPSYVMPISCFFTAAGSSTVPAFFIASTSMYTWS